MKKILDVDKRISKNNKSVLFVEFDLNKFQNLFLHPQKNLILFYTIEEDQFLSIKNQLIF